MKAVILAAGVGSRLSPLTDNAPKAMIPVNGEPLLVYQIRALREAGFDPKDIVVVTGHAAAAVAPVVPEGVRLLHNPEFATKNNIYSFWLLQDQIDDDFLLLNSDVYFPKVLVKRVLERAPKTCLVVDGGKPVADEEMKVEFKRGILRRVSKKLKPSLSDGEYIGLARFAKEDAQKIFVKAKELLDKGQTGVWYENAIDAVVDEVEIRSYTFKTVPWIEIDTHEDLAKARDLLPAVEAYDAKAAEVAKANGAAPAPRKIVKTLDAWYTVLLTDPIAIPLTYLVANKFPKITPNHLTAAAFVLGFVAAWLFYLSTPMALVCGALLYQFCFMLDCMDGKLARLTGRSSLYAAFYDLYFDLFRTMICFVALLWGQYTRSNFDHDYILLGIGVAFVYGFSIINLQKINSVRRVYIESLTKKVQEKLAKRRSLPSSPPVEIPSPAPVAKKRHLIWRTALAIKMLLDKTRIRLVFFSSIEIQCGTLVIAPLFYPWIKEIWLAVVVLAMLQFITLPILFHAKMRLARSSVTKPLRQPG